MHPTLPPIGTGSPLPGGKLIFRLSFGPGFDQRQYSLEDSGRVVVVLDRSIHAVKSDYIAWRVSPATVRKWTERITPLKMRAMPRGGYGGVGDGLYGAIYQRPFVHEGNKLENPMYSEFRAIIDEMIASITSDVVAPARLWIPDRIVWTVSPGPSKAVDQWPYPRTVEPMATNGGRCLVLEGADVEPVWRQTYGIAGAALAIRDQSGRSYSLHHMTVDSPGYSLTNRCITGR